MRGSAETAEYFSVADPRRHGRLPRVRASHWHAAQGAAPGARSGGDIEVSHAMARAVGGIVDLDLVFRSAVDALSEHLREDGVAIPRCDHAAGLLVLAAAAGGLRIAPDYAQDPGSGLLGHTVRTGRSAGGRRPAHGRARHRVVHERLDAELARAARHGRPLSVALLDLDHVGLVNDAHGHQAGDRVLVEVAARLTGPARAEDVIGRAGGEEFALIPETDAAAAHAVAERARWAIAASPFGDVGRMTASVGICDTAHARTGSDLLRLADGALYGAEERAEHLERMHALAALRALARAVDAEDRSTREHSSRVAALAHALALERGWDHRAARDLRRAGLLHDVGKIGLPDAVLLKAGPLSPAEAGRVRDHAALGAEIVAALLPAEQVAWVRHHHERWDGTGYPDGLAGVAIPEGARLIAIADAWDAMTSDRPYRDALPPAAASAELDPLIGRQFCPEAVAALRAVLAGGMPSPAPADERPLLLGALRDWAWPPGRRHGRRTGERPALPAPR